MSSQPLIAVLAAGSGSRFGGGKLDADCAGRALGSWALKAVAAAGAEPGIIVTPVTAPRFALAATRDGWGLVRNPASADGIASSVATAAAHAARSGASALVILLADMPLITPEMIRRLVEAHAPALATRHRNGTPGVPARFPASCFSRLRLLDGDQGAGRLLRGEAGIGYLDADPLALLDVDDAAALDAVAEVLRRRHQTRGDLRTRSLDSIL